VKLRCDWCDRPTSDRYLVFAKGDNPPPEQRASSAIGLVCLACRDFLRAHPEKAGLPKSARREALDDFIWEPIRAAVAAASKGPVHGESLDEVFGGLR
jgi:hypothetical protein